jgi:uncharacterized DUF497 family protein
VATTFDPKKDATNVRKHGISLAEGDGVLSDPLALTIEDTAAVGEQRFVTIGANMFGQLRVVVYSHRGEDQKIISVRKPEPKEVREYEKGV